MDTGFAEAFSEMEAIAKDGGVAVIKVDGERLLSASPDIYTVVLSGGALGPGESYRCDGSDLVQLMRGALSFYNTSKNS